MAIYEFKCECGNGFEARNNIGDYNAVCPNCGKEASKLMSLVNWSFGWALSDASQERFGPKDEYIKDV